MYKLIRIGVVSLYVLLTGVSVLFMLAVAGVYISWWILTIAMTAWALTCWLSVYLLSPIFNGSLRKPILSEEARLQGCWMEVLKSADCHKTFRLRIIEEKAERVFSSGVDIIAVSASLLDRLTDEELKGVLAHELGHLLSRDGLVSWSFATAGYLPRRLRRTRSVWGLLLLLPLLFFIVSFFSNTLIFPIGALWLFLVSSILLDVIFRWLHLLLLRQREYSQDAFAHRLGYGRGLRDALVKRARTGEQRVNRWFILLRGTPPVIYDRIRRLERLIYQ